MDRIMRAIARRQRMIVLEHSGDFFSLNGL